MSCIAAICRGGLAYVPDVPYGTRAAPILTDLGPVWAQKGPLCVDCKFWLFCTHSLNKTWPYLYRIS